MFKLITKHLKTLVLGGVSLVFLMSIFFVFRNFNQTLNQAELVLNLQQRVAPAVLNQRLFDEVMTQIDLKTLPNDKLIIKDPF